MDFNLIETIFDYTNCAHLFKKFKYPIYVTGIFDGLEDEALLSSFLIAFDFNHEDELHFDEFVYYFNMYKNMYKKNNLELWNSV